MKHPKWLNKVFGLYPVFVQFMLVKQYCIYRVAPQNKTAYFIIAIIVRDNPIS